MFLPVESLYAEVMKRPGLCEKLQRELRVVTCGPSTLAALLNSLQMGFRTLAIQKQSSEVWKLLGAVRTEFDKFGDVLEATQNRINQANAELDKLISSVYEDKVSGKIPEDICVGLLEKYQAEKRI